MSERTDLVTTEEAMSERNQDILKVVPLVDIYENEEEILLYVDMPGVDKKEIVVNLDNGKLSLAGVRTVKTAGAVQWEDFGNVEYQRTFSVPQSIDQSRVNAEMKEGVLRLHLPKSEAAKPRQIEITTG